MFIVDDVISKAVSYLFDRVEKSQDHRDEAIASIKIAMRCLSVSFGDIIAFYRKSEHKLKHFLAGNDLDSFWGYFSDMLDEDRLRHFCNESGVCHDLRIAQDKLFSLPPVANNEETQLLQEFASQLEAFEIQFIAAVKEYFQKAQTLDLVAAANFRNADPHEVLATLEKCLAGLEEHKKNIDNLLLRIREKAIAAIV